ncbi:MAG TPA: DUF433 domain-containing protein [Bryobacteraceae bacterium]|nr:DUF433 domain-containing protein [Bryobacteraceae bacterium]
MAETPILEAVPVAVGSDGTIRVSGTRVTLDTLVEAYLRGEEAEAIAESYPAVPLADVYRAIGYYLRHKDEIDDYLRRRQAEAAQIHTAIEARFPQEGIRARLLARRGSK